MSQLLGAAERWYLKVGAVLATVLLPGGIAFFHAEAERTGVPYAAAWVVVVLALALYVAVVPLLATLEGIGQIERVQRMRIAQGLATTAVLWLGIPRIGGLAAVAAASIAQVAIAVTWLAARGQGIVREAIDSLVQSSQRQVEPQFARTQWRTGAASMVGFATPQLLGVVVFSAQGSRSSAQIGLSLAIATVPLTVATAWLQARYPRYARLIAEQRRTELDSLAKRTTMASLGVFTLMTVGLLVVLAVAVRWFPGISERILSPAGLIALFASNLVMLLYQAMAGYLRAHREEPLLPPFFAGATATIIAAAVAATRSGNAAALTYGAVAIGVMLPLITGRFLRQRRRGSERLTG
jgi:O-antigen/teichoic acid export membrane protein